MPGTSVDSNVGILFQIIQWAMRLLLLWILLDSMLTRVPFDGKQYSVVRGPVLWGLLVLVVLLASFKGPVLWFLVMVALLLSPFVPGPVLVYLELALLFFTPGYYFYRRMQVLNAQMKPIEDSRMRTLAALKEKYASGLITEEEYERQRQALSQQTP